MYRPEDKLSPNFTLGEFMKSAMADELQLNLYKLLTAEHFLNLQRVADKLEELRSILGCPIRINSGYRPAQLNEAIGGSKTSAHIFGLAADTFPSKVKGQHDLQNTFFEIANHPTFMANIDQLIIERGCIHVGLCGLDKQPRRELRGESYEGNKRHYPLIRVWGT
jgi:hypothetical protein